MTLIFNVNVVIDIATLSFTTSLMIATSYMVYFCQKKCKKHPTKDKISNGNKCARGKKLTKDKNTKIL